jgi:hypothetical protein
MEACMNLRRTLFLDAATCVATGLLLSLFAVPLAPLLGLPHALLQYAGLSLFPIAAVIAWIGATRTPSKAGVWVVIAGNALWVAASVLLLFVLSPSPLGYAFVIAQAAAVALLAELEVLGLRKAAHAA